MPSISAARATSGLSSVECSTLIQSPATTPSQFFYVMPNLVNPLFAHAAVPLGPHEWLFPGECRDIQTGQTAVTVEVVPSDALAAFALAHAAPLSVRAR